MLQKLSQILIIISSSLCAIAHGDISVERAPQGKTANRVENRKEVDFSKRNDVQFAKSDAGFDMEDMAAVVPMNMRNNSSGIQVEKDILRHWGRNILKSSAVQESAFVRKMKRTASSISKATQLEIQTDKKKKVQVAPKPKSPVDLVKVVPKTQHAFNFKLQALKQEARLIYRGFFNSTLTYKQKSNTLIFQAHKALSENSRLGLSSESVPDGSTTSINYGYSW